MPLLPEVPDEPLVPEEPEVPELPDVPLEPEVPDEPEVPGAPGAPSWFTVQLLYVVVSVLVEVADTVISPVLLSYVSTVAVNLASVGSSTAAIRID